MRSALSAFPSANVQGASYPLHVLAQLSQKGNWHLLLETHLPLMLLDPPLTPWYCQTGKEDSGGRHTRLA